ncbi:MAG: hypothetical protein MHM6MM_006894 [Cercozoa sp. M6MM]
MLRLLRAPQRGCRPSLDALLGDELDEPLSRGNFQKYMREVEFGDESLQFHMEYLERQKEMSPQVLREIYERYLRPDSPTELNVSGNLRRVVAQRIKDLDTESQDVAVDSVFSEVHAEVRDLLYKNSFPRFLSMTLENLSEQERQWRRRVAFFMYLIAVVTVVTLTLSGASRFFRLIPMPLVLVATTTYEQARRGF